MGQSEQSHDNDETPGLVNGINEDAQVVEEVSIMENALNVEAFNEDNTGNPNEAAHVDGTDADVNEDDNTLRDDFPEKTQ